MGVFMNMMNGKDLTSGQREAFRLSGLRVMVDLKFADIPPQVAGAARALSEGDDVEYVFGFTVHCVGGRTMLREARVAVDNTYAGDPEKKPLVIAVTLLTSLDENDLRELGVIGNRLDVAGINFVDIDQRNLRHNP